jgi:TolA-binding protein
MIFNQFLYLKILLLSFLVFFTVANFSLFAQEGTNLIVEEVTLQESFKEVLEENKKLKKEIQNIKNKNKKLNTQLSLYLQRIKNMSSQIELFQRELSAAKKENKKLEEDIVVLKSDLEKAQNDAGKQQELIAAEISSKNAERREDLPNTVGSIQKENKILKKKNGILYYNLGNKLFKKGNYQQAAQKYKQALKYLPSDPDVHYNLAVIYDYYHKDSQKAVAHYLAYIKNKPDSSDLLLVKERIVQNELEVKMEKENKSPF